MELPGMEAALLIGAGSAVPASSAVAAARARAAATAHFALDRASLERLLADAPACELAEIRAAIERADHDDAAIRALARMKLGDELPPDLVADVLVGVVRIDVFFALARHASSEARHALLALFQGGRFADDAAGIHQTSYAAFALWQLHRPEVVRPVLVPRLRRMVRHLRMFVRAAGLVGWLAAQLGDRHLIALYETHHGDDHDGALAETVGRFALDLWSASLDEIIALLPEHAPEIPIPGVPIRVAPKIGRNEPCPCGSGKKFKRCCADRLASAPAGASSSRAERLRASEPRLEHEQLHHLSRADLAQLDLTRLRDRTVLEMVRRQAQLHDWRRACLALDELARRHGKAFADEHLEELIQDALHARHHEAARALLARQGEAPRDSTLRLEIALAAREPTALTQLEAAARVALTDDGDVIAADVAYAALATLPGLGILIARGVLGTSHELDAQVLLESIEEARDELMLPPGDLALELFASLGGEQAQRREAQTEAERARLAQAAAVLRAELDQAAARLTAVQRQVADHQRELERAERTSAEVSSRAARTDAQEQERRALRSKIEELQALIRERNEERSELRRQLSEATESRAGAQAAPEPPPRGREPGEGADDGVEDLPAGGASRNYQIPRFGAAATAALESVPRHVAAAALRTVGELAAGDPAAWRGVKQAKDMPLPVLMARIGIHHRLLFRTDGALDVLDLVTRERLLTTLKRLRSP